MLNDGLPQRSVGATIEAILEEYEGLTIEDSQACLLYASEMLEKSTIMPLKEEAG